MFDRFKKSPISKEERDIKFGDIDKLVGELWIVLS